MTMNSSLHPHDERLAAFAEQADGDDPAIATHLASCDRCRALVTDLRALQVALPGLPDVAPPRPLRLVPPVPAEARSAAEPRGWLRALRQLVAPAYALGVILLVVGIVGMGGGQRLGLTAGGAPAPAAASAAASTAEGGANAPRALSGTPTASPASQGYDQFTGGIASPAQTPKPAPGAPAGTATGNVTETATETLDIPVLLAGLGVVLLLGASAVLVAGRLIGR